MAVRHGGRGPGHLSRWSKAAVTPSGYTDVIVNGGFATDGSPWVALNLSGGTSVGAGIAILSDAADDGDTISQTVTGQGAGTYRLTYTITTRTAESMRPLITGSAAGGTTQTTTGAKSEDIVCESDPTTIAFQIGGSGAPNNIRFDDVTLTRIS